MEKYGREEGRVEEERGVEREREKIWRETQGKMQQREGVKKEKGWRTCVLESNLCFMPENLHSGSVISRSSRVNTRWQCDEAFQPVY